MSDQHDMKPINLNKALLKAKSVKTDPAYREITKGLQEEIEKIISSPELSRISCCVEGCCVSWCCVQIS
jgi:hypothetical protein